MKQTRDYLIVLGGLLLSVFGMYMLKSINDPKGLFITLPYISIGIGCGILGLGMGDILEKNAIKKNPELYKKMDIARKDERNLMIVNQAKAKAYDRMIYTFGILLLIFALIGVDLSVILLLTFAYLFVISSSVYYINRYNKEL